MIAGYLKVGKDDFAERIKKANEILKSCTLCPRSCKVNRAKGELGFCKSGVEAFISSVGPHYGEEPPISGSSDVATSRPSTGSRQRDKAGPKRGSGTIFFIGCNLRCLFCQNYQISQEPARLARSGGYEGKTVSTKELAQVMISLQKRGCHNINLVSPTHFIPQILEAVFMASRNGLRLPLVYNTNGYDLVETLQLLDGIVDIYLPDIKYSSDKYATECSKVTDYVTYNRPALKEMYRQVGNLVMDKDGAALKGLIIRHLVLPHQLAGSFKALDFIKQEMPDAFVSLMAQYHPCYNADEHPLLNRRLKYSEYSEVVRYAESLGLENCYIQELTSSDDFLPDFRKDNPFET